MRPVPELPDVVVYVETLKARIGGRVLEQVHLRSPFVLRSVDPPIDAITGRTVKGVRRLGKRIVLAFDDGPVSRHPPDDRRPLAMAGRRAGLGTGPRSASASFDFDDGHAVPDRSGLEEARVAPPRPRAKPPLPRSIPAASSRLTRDRDALPRRARRAKTTPSSGR